MSDAPPEGDGEDPPRWTRLLAPFQSEQAAFRLLLWVVAIFAVLIAVLLLARAVS